MIDDYILRLMVDFKGLIYNGLETIHGTFTDGIELDINGLSIKSVTESNNNIPYEVSAGKVKIGKTTGNELTVKFEGKISEKSLMGIHKSTYKDGYIITTQMEPTGARSVFPCIDNPSAKARFTIDVEVNDDVEIISNMPPEMSERKPGSSHYKFKKTPKMSTYLIYLGIGNFERIKENHNGKELSVVTTPGKSEQGRFALDLLGKIMDEYEEYYEIDYPLEKMDLIAVPQFGAGAMENWGAITFREIALLVNESTSLNFKKEVGKTLSHEMAHQWFGNLVTMEWWDDLWLNESFATFVGNKILDRIKKKWKTWDEFLGESTLPSMRKDALLSTHPIRVPVKDPSQIAEIFDSISYGKGASILRMIEDFMGEENFRKAVINYLKDHSYGNAKAEDLWNSLAQSSEYNIVGIMKSWLEKGGLPYLRIERENGNLIAEQSRFTLLDNDDPFIWSLPLVTKVNGKTRKMLMEDRKISLPKGENLIVNPKGTGYYRVHYSKDLFDQFASAKMTSENRMKLIDDSYAFLQSGKYDLNEFMKVLDLIRTSNEYSVIFRTIDILSGLNSIVENREIQKFSVEYGKEKLEYLSGSKEENSPVLREKIYNLLAEESEETQKELSLKIDRYDNVAPEEKMAVLIAAVLQDYHVEKVTEKINNPSSDLEQIEAMISMSHLRDIARLKQFLDDALSRNELRGNLLYSLIHATTNKYFRNDIWDWTRKNVNSVYEIYEGSGAISFFVESLVAISGIDHPLQVQEFVKNAHLPEAERAIKNGLESLQVNERLIKRISV